MVVMVNAKVQAMRDPSLFPHVIGDNFTPNISGAPFQPGIVDQGDGYTPNNSSVHVFAKGPEKPTGSRPATSAETAAPQEIDVIASPAGPPPTPTGDYATRLKYDMYPATPDFVRLSAIEIQLRLTDTHIDGALRALSAGIDTDTDRFALNTSLGDAINRRGLLIVEYNQALQNPLESELADDIVELNLWETIRDAGYTADCIIERIQFLETIIAEKKSLLNARIEARQKVLEAQKDY